jgi:hypothetical protein
MKVEEKHRDKSESEVIVSTIHQQGGFMANRRLFICWGIILALSLLVATAAAAAERCVLAELFSNTF